MSHIREKELSICEKQWEWIEGNPVKKISREKESRERNSFPNLRVRHEVHIRLAVIFLIAASLMRQKALKELLLLRAIKKNEMIVAEIGLVR